MVILQRVILSWMEVSNLPFGVWEWESTEYIVASLYDHQCE